VTPEARNDRRHAGCHQRPLDHKVVPVSAENWDPVCDAMDAEGYTFYCARRRTKPDASLNPASGCNPMLFLITAGTVKAAARRRQRPRIL
jgi:hypothetical protein